jgi:signal transduction histidine kinase
MNIHHEQDISKRNAELEKELTAKNRELEIEAALERVRSRANAMHRSENLHDVINEVNDQLRQLGFRFDGTDFLTDHSDKGYNIWRANFPTPIYVPAIDHKLVHLLKEVIKRGDDFLTFTLTTDEKNIYFKNIFENTVAQNSPEELKQYVYSANGMATSCVVLENIILSVTNFASIPYTDTENEILKRFAKVFEQSYTRFLDLQKAEAQARESQIQLALERVRARTMAMQKSDELPETSYLLFQQVKELGLTATQNSIAIINEETGFVELSTTVHGHHLPHTLNVPINDPYVMAKAVAAWKAKRKSLTVEIRGQELKEYNEHRNSFFETKVNFPEDQWIVNIVLFSKGWLSFSSNKNISGETFELLKRFAAVFEQTYIRFNDLKQAEEQARESQIQLALERVRARTMAMQKSDELMETAVVLFDQLKQLGENIERTIIGVMNEEERVVEIWATRPDGSQMEKMQKFPVDEPIVMEKIYAAWRQQQKSIVIDLRGDELESYFQFLKSRGPKLKRENFGERRVENFAFFSKGMLGVINVDPNTPANVGLYERFAAVFDQTYTRFLDLQKAEAQAREAQIEAALEKVRGRAMAMHKSEELLEAGALLYAELSKLGIEKLTSGYMLIDEDEKMGWNYGINPTNGQIIPKPVGVPLTETKEIRSILEAWKRQEAIHVKHLDPEETIIHQSYMADHAINFPISKEKLLSITPERLVIHTFNFKQGYLIIVRGEVLSAEQQEMVLRFAKVFEMTYRRFLDLQKAEAQVREAQIETGLERVRSKTMAMHKSEEVTGIAVSLNEELLKLGFEGGSTIIIIDKQTGDTEQWTGFSEDKTLQSCNVPYFKHPYHDALLDAWKRGEKFLVYTLTGKEKKTLDEHYFTTGYKDFPESDKKWMRQMKSVTFSHAFMKYGAIHWGPGHLTEEQLRILQRFSKVFEQSYTRFLDLQKAEAQAREAKIEAALERVRSRAMAMQNSDELKELIGTVFTELTKLDIVLTRCLIMIYDPRSNDSIWWMANSEAPTEPIGLRIQNHGHSPYVAYLKAWQEKKLKWVYVLEGAVKKDWDNFLFVETELSHLPDFVIAGMKAPDRVYLNSSFNSFGNLTLASLEPLSNEHSDILLRFAKVFDLTYTRFNDLKQAEAQAEESRIQLALERVRARTMAMQKSNELTETSFLIFQQFKELGSAANQMSIGIINEQENVMEMSATIDGSKLDSVINVSLNEPIVMKKLVVAWKQQKGSLIIELSGDELKKYNDYRNSISKLKFETKEGDHWVIHIAFFSKGMLSFSSQERHSDEIVQLLERFAAVFDLTYTRFLDLQKAEAQTREAQIELALERVRARTMAMHKSEELAQTSQVLFHQLLELGRIPDRISIGIADESNSVVNFWTTDQQGLHLDHSFSARLDERTTIAKTYQAWKEQKKSLVVDLHGEELKEWIQFAREEMGIAVKDDQIKDRRVHSLAFFSHGWILVTSHEPQLPDTLQILERFASVFNLTYRRFLDLQKAEVQAREAQIEVSLERVRASAMAMHNSQDLSNTIRVFYQQIGLLSETPRRCGIDIIDKDTHSVEISSMNTTEEGQSLEAIGKILLKGHRILDGIYDNWLLQKEYYPVLKGDEIREYYDFVRPHVGYPDYIQDAVHYGHFFPFPEGCIYVWTTKGLSEDELKIYRRFTSVLSLTYKRYKDLQQAEAQAKEAQIEASLERVRSKTMAMHNSQDVADTVATMFDELVKLGVETVRCGIAIIDESKTMEVWTASSKEDGSVKLIIGQLDMRNHPLFRQVYDAWKKKELVTTYELIGEDLKDYFRNINNSPNYSIRYDIESLPYRQSNTAFMFPEGSLFVFSQEPLVTETIQIFKRFAGLFGQTYRRYLDLQKAETNAREAQIEAGLERVRAKAMAMHSSKDLAETLGVFYRELKSLSVTPIRCGVALMDKESRMAELTTMNTTGEGDSIEIIGKIKMTGHPVLDGVFESWLVQKEYHAVLRGNQIKEYYQVLKPQIDYLDYSHDEAQFGYYFMFNEGDVYAWTEKELTEDELTIYRRFTTVISLTYKRYKDLQQAEAQAREATIEAALEKVRGKAMAMHNSNDLSVTASMVFTELRKLGINPMRSGVGILNKDDRKALWYATANAENEDSLSLVGWSILDHHPVLTETYDSWRRGEDYYPVLKGESLKSYFEQVRKNFPVPPAQANCEQYGYYIAFSEGVFYGFSERPFSEDNIKILKRFASVIDLTFRRYIELQKSEANAREAIKQAALDRVRAEIASMRTINDLDRITPLIWNELNVLGIPFIRCGVFIMDEDQQLIHTFLSAPDGKAIAAFHLPYTAPGNLRDVISHWREKQNYISHWSQVDFVGIAETLVEQGAIASKEQYLGSLPKDGFYLHFLPFLQGMLYVGNTDQLKEEEITLIQHVADAFSTAYARYEDFNKLEAAKQTVEKTLTDLKQTQQQLVQSEKMASLGELTAGIAHEIQNPLNFVNNFSEVSKELLDEMKTELETGNTEDAKDIADDVIQNLEKINHHGKRADAIVKSMLQHSRSSSGKKEPTDINALADEYLRLAYHGLRAKDKSFNSKFETEFDSSIRKINIISQDIGRVLVNLINNAFYAVSERKKQESNGYEPTVTVHTKKTDDKIEIKVKDNGNGIPQKVLDKIFQPFFTTKPTGQGTGLGLSLAYDIITKGHGGELKVETKEGEGSEFIIQLPLI